MARQKPTARTNHTNHTPTLTSDALIASIAAKLTANAESRATSAVLAKIANALGLDLAGGVETTPEPAEIDTPATPRTNGHTLDQLAARQRTRRASGDRVAYRAVKRNGKAGGLADVTPHARAAFDVVARSGKMGATILDCEHATGRSTKQLENDLYWLRSHGFIASDWD